MIPDKEFIKNRIIEQFDYCIEIVHSDRGKERKIELLESAHGVIKNLLQYFNDLDGILFFYLASVQYVARINKPMPNKKFEYGGIVSSESEIIIRKFCCPDCGDELGQLKHTCKW